MPNEETTYEPAFAHPEVEVVYIENNGTVRTTNTRVTVAYHQVGQEVTYAVAYCAPTDNFCRATGRNIAAARLQNGYKTVDMELWSESNQFGDILANVLAGELPSRWLSAGVPSPDDEASPAA